jgi:hypothetical protein
MGATRMKGLGVFAIPAAFGLLISSAHSDEENPLSGPWENYQHESIQPDFEADARRQSALLECAVLAASGQSYKDYAASLYVEAFETIKATAEKVHEGQLVGVEDNPIAEAVKGVHPHFWIGIFVATTSNKIDEILEKDAPSGGGASFDQVMELRAIVADREFEHRNCRLL